MRYWLIGLCLACVAAALSGCGDKENLVRAVEAAENLYRVAEGF